MPPKTRKGMEEGQSSRNVSKKGRAPSSSRIYPSTLPQSCFWNAQGRTFFYEDEIQARRGRNSQPIRTGAGNDRTLCPALALKLEFLEENSFHNIARMLVFQGWDHFLKMNIPFEPSMIRQFYHNLIPSTDDDETSRFRTKVYGKSINVSSSIFSQYFGNDNLMHGAKLNGQNFNEFCPMFNIDHARSSLLEPESSHKMSPLVSDFTIENRLLFHILTKVITPRSGSFTKPTDFDIGIMFFIRHYIKICLGDLMVNHIAGIAHNRTRSCAYTMPLTHFLINECNVLSNSNDSIVPKQMWYDEKTLRMLFNQNEHTGIWERKYVPQNIDVEPEDDQMDQDQYSPIGDPWYPPGYEAPYIDPNQSHFDPNHQTQFNPDVTYNVPPSSFVPPFQAPYDPFHSAYNPSTYQSDMFSMMQQMNIRQEEFATDMRAATTHLEERMDDQDRNIHEIHDSIEEMKRQFHYF